MRDGKWIAQPSVLLAISLDDWSIYGCPLCGADPGPYREKDWKYTHSSVVGCPGCHVGFIVCGNGIEESCFLEEKGGNPIKVMPHPSKENTNEPLPG